MAEEGGGEGEPDSIFFTPTLSLPRQKGEGKDLQAVVV